MKFQKSGLLIAAVLASSSQLSFFYLITRSVLRAKKSVLLNRRRHCQGKRQSFNCPDDTSLAQKSTESSAKAMSRPAGASLSFRKDGRVLYSHDADKVIHAGIEYEVYTTAVGWFARRDYRWRTSVYARKQPDSNGVLDGELILYGQARPILSPAKG
jgi:D-alanyl-D-alanine carboxypeptidase